MPTYFAPAPLTLPSPIGDAVGTVIGGQFTKIHVFPVRLLPTDPVGDTVGPIIGGVISRDSYRVVRPGVSDGVPSTPITGQIWPRRKKGG